MHSVCMQRGSLLQWASACGQRGGATTLRGVWGQTAHFARIAELLYEKAQLSWGKSNAAKGPVRIWLRLAATQYEKVAKHPNKKYRKNALFGAVLCYESLLKGRGKAHLPLRTVSKRGGVSHSGTLRMLGKSWSLIWPRLSIQPNSLNQKLLRAYKNYLSVLNARSDIEAITQTRFKEGTLYYERKHYLKSIAIFTRLVKLYPNHKLSALLFLSYI